jgi:hypothetical protein
MPDATIASQQLFGGLRPVFTRGIVCTAESCCQASRNGCTARQPFSILSARWNSVWSPVRQS